MTDHERELSTYTYGKILGPPPRPEHFCLFQISQNIDGFRQTKSRGF